MQRENTERCVVTAELLLFSVETSGAMDSSELPVTHPPTRLQSMGSDCGLLLKVILSSAELRMRKHRTWRWVICIPDASFNPFSLKEPSMTGEARHVVCSDPLCLPLDFYTRGGQNNYMAKHRGPGSWNKIYWRQISIFSCLVWCYLC